MRNNSCRKLVIQIPCFNEAEALPAALACLPKKVEGYDETIILVIDDGSSDGTEAVAIAHDVSHVIRHTKNRGLAQTFMTGLHESVRLGAHTIVNFDADCQYNAVDIPKLTAPILDGKAQVVIGARPIGQMKQFSAVKKCLQYAGSWLARMLTRTDVQDVTSGFRAIHVDVARELVIFSRFSYTVEMVFHVARQRHSIVSIPVGVCSGPTRPSRLASNSLEYLARSGLDLMRWTILLRPRLLFGLFMFVFILSALAIIGCWKGWL